MEEYILFELINNKKNLDEEQYINIDSPLFNIISKTKVFNEMYTIYISKKNIDDFKLKDYYIKIFNTLNNENKKYSSIFYTFKEKAQLNYLKELNINFNNIKRLRLKCKEDKMNNNESLIDGENILNSFKNLEKLILIGNENIIKLFKNATLEELKELILMYNFISDFKVLESVKFDKLKILNLHRNEISDISFLEKVNFTGLKELYLSYNKISDIKALEKVKFKNLDVLNLQGNEIQNVNISEDINFNSLKIFDLSYNKISEIKISLKENIDKLEQLEKIFLKNNVISNIIISEKIKFKQLKELDLSFNIISNLKILEKMELFKLEILNLSFNENIIYRCFGKNKIG